MILGEFVCALLRMVNLYVMVMCWIPLGVSEFVLGDHLPIRNPNVPIIWGAINLVLTMIWSAYYFNMCWKRVHSTNDDTELSYVVGDGPEQGAKTVTHHVQNMESASTAVTV